jgi:Fe-S-cluster containining protein
MSNDTEPWYKDGLRFECQCCGGCCTGEPGYVWVNQDDIKALSAEMKLSAVLFERAFVYNVNNFKRSLKEYPNGDCVLLDEKKRCCKTYNNRPMQCRTWPFWSDNIYSQESWDLTAQFCPGCNKGKLYTKEEIEEQRDKWNP